MDGNDVDNANNARVLCAVARIGENNPTFRLRKFSFSELKEEVREHHTVFVP